MTSEAVTRRGSKMLLVFWIVALFLVPRPAAAILLYLEGGTGATIFVGANPLFPTFTATSGSIGPNWSGGLHMTVTDGSGPFDFHIGANFRSSASNLFAGTAWTSYQFLSAYPEIKLQISIFYIGLGVTPFIWSRESNVNWGIDNLQTVSGRFNFISEVGIMYSWTPLFTIGLSATAQFVTTGFFGSPMGPMPSVDAQFFMRFYLWRQNIPVGTASKAQSVDPAEYKGWRYPGGWQK